MAYETATLGTQTRVEKPVSRIDTDVIRLKEQTQRVRLNTERLMRHAHSLGYLPPPSQGNTGQAPTPVITNLNDAVCDLDRALDEMSGAMNLFD
jgi:hypothetical protein